MSWLRAITFLFTLLAFVLQPASASALGPAHSEARVSAFELVAMASVGASAETSPGLHEGIRHAYDENASGYRFAARGAGRGGTKLKPDSSAQGPHSTFKRDPATGKVTGHAEWDAAGNPVKRTDVTGSAHGPVQTPHTHEYGPPNVNPATGKSYPGNEVRVRPATPDEIPK